VTIHSGAAGLTTVQNWLQETVTLKAM